MTSSHIKFQNYVIHLIYACSIFMAVLLIIGYLIWSKHLADINESKREEQIRLQQNNLAHQEREHQYKVGLCLNKVMELYTQDWKNACAQKNNINKKNFALCKEQAAAYAKYIKSPYTTKQENDNLYNYQLTQCKSMYSFSNNPNLNCLLPTSIANGLNDQLKKYEQRCRETA